MINQKKRQTRDGAPKAPAPPDSEAARRDIAQRAYGRYCARGRIDGLDVEDWLVAEQEVLREHESAAAASASRSRSAARRSLGRAAAAPDR